MDVAFTSQNRSKWQNENQAVMKRWKQLHDQVGIANEEYAAVENELKMIEARLQKKRKMNKTEINDEGSKGENRFT